MVLKVVCPTVRLPSETSNRKRPRGDMGWNDEASTFSSSTSDGSKRRFSGISEKREEINDIFTSVKDFSSTTFQGLKRRHYREDVLTKLGAPAVKQQKMPFKQRVGLAAAKKKRDVKNEEKAKESGVVLATVNKKSRNDRGRREGSTNSRSTPGRASSISKSHTESSAFGITTKSGVMHLSKKRLPEKLMRQKR